MRGKTIMNNSIDAIIIRTRKSFYQDGLWELLAGGILLFASFTILVFPDGNRGALIFTAGILAFFYLYTWLKRRFTYPRSGYAVYKEQGLKARLLTILKRTILLGILLILYFILQSPGQLGQHRWLVLMAGIFIGLGWIWQGMRLGLARLAFLGLCSLLFGAALPPLLPLASGLGTSTTEILGIYFLLMGAVFLLSGGITFSRYLQRMPAGEGEG
jgi:hypothetical protein